MRFPAPGLKVGVEICGRCLFEFRLPPVRFAFWLRIELAFRAFALCSFALPFPPAFVLMPFELFAFLFKLALALVFVFRGFLGLF